MTVPNGFRFWASIRQRVSMPLPILRLNRFYYPIAGPLGRAAGGQAADVDVDARREAAGRHGGVTGILAGILDQLVKGQGGVKSKLGCRVHAMLSGCRFSMADSTSASFPQ